MSAGPMRVILTADVSVTPAPEQFPHAMLDIETMAQHTSRALILSIAALPFALEPDGPRFGEPVLMLPDLGAQLLAGRMVEARTQGFWAKQPPAASEHWLGKTATHQPAELLDALTDWLEMNTAKKAELWARGQGFDFANLDNIMDAPPGKSPWWFPNLRDQRTATTFFPKLRDRPADLVIPAAAHDPVYDCMTQAWALWERAPAEAIGLDANPVREDVGPTREGEGGAVTLEDCPPGLFRFKGRLGFKTEYRAMESVGPTEVPGDQLRWKVGRWPEAFVVSSGEVFWGGTHTQEDRAKLLVTPVRVIEP